MVLKLIRGDLLKSKQDYIVQQCNCISVKPHGLSKIIADNLGVDVYSKRRSIGNRNLAIDEDHAIPGTIEIIDNVICMYAQYGMGKPYSFNNKNKIWIDSYSDRLEWFKMCLNKIAELNIKSIAFPYKIGCGLAGGNWENDYYPEIKKFSELHPDISIKIYKLD